MKIHYKTIEKDLEYLRQISKEVDLSNNAYKKDVKILSDLCATDENILALAAVQVGIPKRLIYLKKTDLSKFDDSKYNEKKVLINPVITKAYGLTRYWEACASCLDNLGLVERPYKIELEYYDINKKKYKEIFKGFSATVICHEIDHLNGILHIDKAIKIYHMDKDQRIEFRKNHPYEIINKIKKYNINI